MAKAKKKKKRAKAMQVVSLKSALHMVRTASKRIKARRIRKRRNPIGCDSNPLRHFPKMKGRGRPAKIKTWNMVTRLANGMVAEKPPFRATKEQAHALAGRVMKRKFHGSRVKEIILED